MSHQNAGYIKDVDDLIERTRIETVLSHYGCPTPSQNSGEFRMNCPFNESCSDSKYGNLAISLSDPANVIFCHSCGIRGNLITLIHGLETHTPPTGGRLRGAEFKVAVQKLRAIGGGVSIETPPSSRASVAEAQVDSPTPVSSAPPPIPRNVPLIRSENEVARTLATLYEDLLVEPDAMSPKAAQYIRSREWLDADTCRKWGVGYLPRDGRSMYRGWFVYTHHNQAGDVLTYSGRDVGFDEKWEAWIRDGKPNGKKPLKHKYVKGYRRGLELYGQRASRLDEPAIAASLKQIGLVVVEGMNDVIRLDTLGVGAVGICSNRGTDEQVAKIVKFAKKVAGGRVVLMPDCDEDGEVGFKELLWQLAERDLSVRLAWSSRTEDGKFAGRQPESIQQSEWHEIAKRLI